MTIELPANIPVDPYLPNSSFQKEPLVLAGKEVAALFTSGNDKRTPQTVIDWITRAVQEAQNQGYTNLRIRCISVEGGPDNLESDRIALLGDRYETIEEHDRRLKSILSNWRRRYEEYIRDKKFYEESPVGKAQLMILEQSKEPK